MSNKETFSRDLVETGSDPERGQMKGVKQREQAGSWKKLLGVVRDLGLLPGGSSHTVGSGIVNVSAFNQVSRAPWDSL